MRLSVLVKPNARKDEVTVREDGAVLISVTAPPVAGKANERVIEVLARHLRKPKRNLSIVSGHRGKHKIIEVR